MRPKVLALCGATASGKSGLSLKLAKQLNAEIVCMDSMQIYQRMDIGTAKPTKEEQAMVPHHMLDLIPPEAGYAVADYCSDASEVIRGIIKRNHLPILVGGTGLYLRSLMQGFHLGETESNPEVRTRLQEIASQENGAAILHAKLEECDPLTAAKFHQNDLRRVIRALEVFETTGIPISERKNLTADNGDFEILPMAIDVPRDKLYMNIEMRSRAMMNQGLVREVRQLLESGVPVDCQSMQAIGYKELVPVILHHGDAAEALHDIIIHTKHYAKRQGTWFRGEASVQWLKPENTVQEAMTIAEAFLSGKGIPGGEERKIQE